jgi:hypothetical protein
MISLILTCVFSMSNVQDIKLDQTQISTLRAVETLNYSRSETEHGEPSRDYLLTICKSSGQTPVLAYLNNN